VPWNVPSWTSVLSVWYANPTAMELSRHGLLFVVSGISFGAMEWFHHGLLIDVWCHVSSWAFDCRKTVAVKTLTTAPSTSD